MVFLFDDFLTTLVYLLIGLALFIVGKVAYQIFHPSIKVRHELVEADNFAFTVSYVGYFIGLLLAIGSAVMGETNAPLIEDIIDTLIYGFLAIVLMNLSILINDKLILPKFKVKKEIIEDKNIGTGVIEGAMCIATGLIILGAIHGESFGSGSPILIALVFWGLGQALLFITSKIYNLITPYDVHDHIERDNVAVGIGFAGAIIAIANLIRFAIMHDFEDWISSIEDIAFDVTIGFILLPVARWFADKILLPGRKLTDEIVNQEHPNNGAALIEAFAYIGGSMLITWAL